ncbi:hypothetical protein [Halorarum salinum]|nr:hypothetical protein [Halobaculum salinum]
MSKDSMIPLLAIVVVAVALIGLAYLNITGVFQISGAALVDRNTATIIVAILFLLMVPWAYRRAKSS